MRSTSSDAGSVALDLGPDVGAVVVRTAGTATGEELQIEGADRRGVPYRTHAVARRRALPASTLTAAVFPSVPAGEYTVWVGSERVQVQVEEGLVTDATLPSSPM